MSIKKISKQQPETFEFSEENLIISRKIISKYPEGKQQSAVMSLLYLVQNQNQNCREINGLEKNYWVTKNNKDQGAIKYRVKGKEKARFIGIEKITRERPLARP